MKKLLTLVSVGAVACMSVIASINWNSGAITNLAQGASVTVSSNPTNAQLIVDNDNGSGWQASAATHKYTQDWVLIDLKSEQTFTDMEIVWEASHCKKYSVYVSSTEIPWTAEQAVEETKNEAGDVVSTTTVDYNKINAAWLENNTPVATSGNDTEAGYTDNISFTESQKGQYILIYADEYNNFGSQYGMRIFDVRVANIENRDEITELQLTAEGNAVAGGDPVTVTVAPLNKIGEAVALDKVSNLQLTCDNAAVTIEAAAEAGKYNVSASADGTYTLTATATADGKTVTGTYNLVVAFNWNGTENIATGKTIQGRVKADTEDPNPPANAVDGNLETYYQYNGEWGGGDGWLLVDLGDNYDISAIGAYYSTNAGGKCVFGYAVNADAVNAKIAEGTDWVWAANDATINEGWTFTPELARTANVVTTHKFEKTVLARYIVIKDADNPQGKPCVNEIYVSGKIHEAPKATNIEITLEKGGLVIGETNTVTATVVDQYGEVMTGATPEITVTGAEYANGTITANAKGMVTVTAKVGELTAEKSFYVADQDDYCLAGCEITASEGAAADKAPVYDGGKDINAWGADYVLAPGEPAGDHTHWFMVKLAKPYNIDLIAALWEGASPADYNIYLGTSENDLTLYYTEKDKAGLQNYSDRFSGKEMNNIQYIKVETTKNATQYGIKLHDFKVYGTSAVESVPTTVEVSASDNGILVGQTVTLSAKVLDQYGAEMEGQTVTYTCEGATIEGDKFTASAVGDYTVTATCGEVTGTIVINVAAAEDQKLSAEAAPNTVTLNGTALENVNILSNNDINIPELPSTLVVTFEKPISCNLLAIRWETACPSEYTVEATYKDGTTATIYTLNSRPAGAANPVDKIVNGVEAALDMEGTAKADLNGIKSLKLTVMAKNHDWTIRLFGIDAYGTVDDTNTAIDNIVADGDTLVDVYTIQGIKVRSNVKAAEALQGLPHGLYIVGGRKVVL